MDSGTQDAEQTPRGAPRATRIAYLLSRYPAISHTFFLHEVVGLRARGLQIETASINRPDRELSDLPPLERAEARRTYYIKSKRRGRLLKNLLGVVLTRPAVVLRGLVAVAKQKRLSPVERLYWLFYLAEALLVGRWMSLRRLHHLHIHFGGPVASVGLLTARAWKIPFSLTIHGPEELLNLDANHLHDKVREAKFVFCISDFCRSQLFALVPPEQWSKFQVIRLGVDPLVLTPPPRPGFSGLHARSCALRLVSIGRMVPAKGHRILLEALRLVRDRGMELKVTLIGGGPELISLQHYVLEHGLAETVCFTQALSHAQALTHLRGADLFALASFAEGIPVALMEAMSLGIPSIGTSIAGIPELIRSGVDGLLVPPANPQALAAAIESLLLDPNLRKVLGAAARQRIINQYNLPLNQELLAHSFRQRMGDLQDDAATD